MKRWVEGRSPVSVGTIGVVLGLLALNHVRVRADDGLLEGDVSVFRGQVRLSHVRDSVALAQAVQGAHRRLGSPPCRALFSDFADTSGRTLQSLLDEAGLTGQSHLRRLLFYDAPAAASCRSPGVLAFTHPGSRVVLICRGFRDAFALNSRHVEAILIHELLHTLGLGENPPTSDEITRRVRARCQ